MSLLCPDHTEQAETIGTCVDLNIILIGVMLHDESISLLQNSIY